MVGLHARLESDVVINPFSWNTVVFRNRAYYSVNHYSRGRSFSTGMHVPERFEFRYELTRPNDWQNMKLNPSDFGVVFDSHGYAKIPV